MLGEKSYASLKDVPFDVDVVQVFRAKEHVMPVAQEAIAQKDRLKLKVFWLQEGVINHEAAATASASKLGMVMNRCIYKEAQRMQGPMQTY